MDTHTHSHTHTHTVTTGAVLHLVFAEYTHADTQTHIHTTTHCTSPACTRTNDGDERTEERKVENLWMEVLKIKRICRF